jgi:hypothetical protein
VFDEGMINSFTDTNLIDTIPYPSFPLLSRSFNHS